MKVNGTIDKFKARLVIQGFRQKEGIDYFDTYAPVARITTIRLLLAIKAIHNLVIHQMDVKTTFLNGDLDEEVYMKQPEGFVMPGNEHKVCKLVKSLYGLKQAPKQWHQKFDEVVLSSGFLLNQSDKCVYSKFNSSGEGVIICLYVDDMLIFGTDRNQVDKTKKFLSSKFSMKDMGEADVILDCSPVSTPMDPVEKLKPNTGKPVDQLEYSRVIGCLMYAMTSTRPDIAYAVGRLSRFTSNPSRQHWQAITRIHLLRVDGCSCLREVPFHRLPRSKHASLVLLSEFVALAAAGKEAEWLRNLIHEILIWPKPIAPISIRCDSAPTMAKAYSQIYNGKSRHLGVRHSMIRELIMNGVISIEFVRSQKNLADHLTKGLARDLVNKCKTKRITYVNMKFCRFKKLGLGFLYSNGLTVVVDHNVESPSGGWDTSTDLESWAKAETFTVGDNLVFTYGGSHEVLEVTKDNYDSCITSGPISTSDSSPTTFSLTVLGIRYFICGTAGHCEQGMKVEIQTIPAATPPPAFTSPPPSFDSPAPAAPPVLIDAPPPNDDTATPPHLIHLRLQPHQFRQMLHHQMMTLLLHHLMKMHQHHPLL
ncbi:zinc finger, CCHC-type containing protein [Tanacetum coccineum]